MWSFVSLIALALCVPILQVQRVSGQDCKFVKENGEEIIDSSGFGYILPTIQDIEKPGKELLVAEAINVVNITNVSSESTLRRYMEPTLNGSYLQLKLNDEFPDYEEYEFSKSTSINVIFACVAGMKKIQFVQPIEDTNNHDPKFEHDSYIYKLPMPIPKNLALNNFVPIAARDIDLTNTNISFTLDADTTGFSVSWLSMDTSDRKRHYATLVTTAVINLVDDTSFYLYATDTGTPPRTSNTTVTIEVDRENSVLRFAESLYIANLTTLKPAEADGKDIHFDAGEVRLGSGADKTVSYTFQDEFSDYNKNFRLITAEDHSSVKLRLINPPDAFFQESFILLSLMAEKPGAKEKTILHLSLPGNGRGICLPASEESNECEYLVATIVLSIFLGVFAIGLVVSVIINCRHWRK